MIHDYEHPDDHLIRRHRPNDQIGKAAEEKGRKGDRTMSAKIRKDLSDQNRIVIKSGPWFVSINNRTRQCEVHRAIAGFPCRDPRLPNSFSKGRIRR